LEIPGYRDVARAEKRIRAWVHRTPVLRSATLDEIAGRRLYFKAEHLQRTGSYKARGAANHLHWLVATYGGDLKGVVAASSGNHGQAVAWAARRVGTRAEIVVPASISPAKLAAIRSYGAHVTVVGLDSEERLTVAANLAAKHGLAEIPPYDHPLTIAGQGTWLLEAARQVEEPIEAVVVPISGGGLAAGTCLAAESMVPRPAVYAAEPEGADDTRQSLAAGQRVRIEPNTIADALRASQPGLLTFEVYRRRLAGVVCVSDSDIGWAMRLIWERTKQVVEPAGAVAVAAVLRKLVSGDGAVLVVLSGGNVDLDGVTNPWWASTGTTQESQGGGS
jgi:threonine dehydratase